MTFSKNAATALNAASSCARQLGHDHVGCEHILLSILAIPNCQAVTRFKALGLAPEDLSESMRQMIQGEAAGTLQRGQLPISARTRKVVEMAGLDAGKDNQVDTVHLVLAMLREGENAASQLLFNAGVTVEKFIAAGAAKGSGDSIDPSDPSDPVDSNDAKGPRSEGANG